MSRRALRRLRGEQRGQEPLGPGALQFVLHDDDDVEEECPKRGPGGRRPRGAGKEGVRVNNRFELVRHGATWGGGSRWGRCARRVRDVTGRGDEGLGCSGGGGAKEVGGDLRPGAELRWFCAAGRGGAIAFRGGVSRVQAAAGWVGSVMGAGPRFGGRGFTPIDSGLQH